MSEKKQHFLQLLSEKRLFFDGAMGTTLFAKGLRIGDIPETWNVLHPEVIREIHESYLEAGCQILKANTFGVSRYKVEGTPYTAPQLIKAGIALAREAAENVPTNIGKALVALDIGPLGKLMEPLGDLSFDEAVEAFAETVRTGAELTDLILLETFNDPYEMKAALLAAKENSDLPVVLTMTIDSRGRLLSGGDPIVAVAMAEGLGVDLIGFNCGFGPEQMKKFVPDLVKAASVPVVVNPNAGLPEVVNGVTTYAVRPEAFARMQLDILKEGVTILGGCCGTTPAHLRRMIELCENEPIVLSGKKERTIVSSYGQWREIGEKPLIIGERINPTGKKKLKAALREGDFGYLQSEALKQESQGADILDVNVGLPEIDEPAVMERAVKEIQKVTDLPLQIDTSDPVAMERALRHYNGKPMINSVNGKEEVMNAVFPLAKKYGGVVVGLTIDENGIPDTAEGRFAIAKRIVERAEGFGIAKKNIVIDTLTLTIATGPSEAEITLDALKMVKERLGVGTVLGVSNVSFGLPNRELINSAFYTMALDRGLSAGIVNPGSRLMKQAYDVYLALHGFDEGCRGYIEGYSDPALTKAGTEVKSPKAPAASDEKEATSPLFQAILDGLSEKAKEETGKALQARDSLEIINEDMIPALELVGARFEKGEFFLPQLMMSAKAAQEAFSVIKAALGDKPKESKGTVIMATVKGDIHDIGKNIVKVLLENFGFEVIDLGKDVPPEVIVEEAKARSVKLVGLSALMTTTVENMAETIRLMRKEYPECLIMVGGAALSETYAKEIGADFYSKDAMGAVHYAESVFG